MLVFLRSFVWDWRTVIFQLSGFYCVRFLKQDSPARHQEGFASVYEISTLNLPSISPKGTSNPETLSLFKWISSGKARVHQGLPFYQP